MIERRPAGAGARTTYVVDPKRYALDKLGPSAATAGTVVQVRARLTDPVDGTPVQSKVIDFALEVPSTDTGPGTPEPARCQGRTRRDGVATCTITVPRASGRAVLAAGYLQHTGDDADVVATIPFTVTSGP